MEVGTSDPENDPPFNFTIWQRSNRVFKVEKARFLKKGQGLHETKFWDFIRMY